MFSLVDKELQEQEKDFAALLAESTYTLLYFYPKDNTPGCTVEANDFTALVKYFLDQHVQIIGVSKDSCASHEKFIRKQ
jgi:peroxiredoxin